MLHADKCNGDCNTTGNGVGKNMAGDKMGNGEGDKGDHHHAVAAISIVLASAVVAAIFIAVAPPKLTNAVVLSAAIAAAVAIAHLFDTAIKQQWRG